MPLPTPTELADMKTYARTILTNLPEDWKINIEVKPWLGYDFQYHIRPRTKSIDIMVYSARFPMTWYGWVKEALTEANDKLPAIIDEFNTFPQDFEEES